MLHVKASGIEIQFFSGLGSKIRYGLSFAIQHLVQSPNFKNLVKICAAILADVGIDFDRCWRPFERI